MTGKDTVMMILAFLAGLILVTIIFGGNPEQNKENKTPSATEIKQVASVPSGEIASIGEGYFVYHSPEGRFFLCSFKEGALIVRDVYRLAHKEPTYHSGVSGESEHGWHFESLTREKEAVLEVRSRQFIKAVDSQDWSETEKLAQEIVAVGGIDFLLEWLNPKSNWCGRRAAALTLASRGYIETVPVLADALVEGPEVRKKAVGFLVKLTGEDFFKGHEKADQQVIIDRYKDWYVSYQENKQEKR